MANRLASNIPVGDLQLYDNYVPALAAGNWHIEISHALTGVDTGALGATQAFVVSAPQFSFDTNAILNRYPPDGSTGLYAQVLPHVVFVDPPYRLDLLPLVLDQLPAHLEPAARVYLEGQPEPENLKRYRLLRECKAGAVRSLLVQWPGHEDAP